MKKITLILLLALPLICLAQPNPNDSGFDNGFSRPRNPNNPNVPLEGIEFLMIGGVVLGSYTIYKKKSKWKKD